MTLRRTVNKISRKFKGLTHTITISRDDWDVIRAALEESPAVRMQRPTKQAKSALALCKSIERSVGRYEGIGHISLAELVDKMCDIAQLTDL